MNLHQVVTGLICLFCAFSGDLFAQDGPQPAITETTKSNAHKRGVSASVSVVYLPRSYSKTQVYFSVAVKNFSIHAAEGYHLEGKVYRGEVPRLMELLNKTSGNYPKVTFDVYYGPHKQGTKTYAISAKGDLGRFTGDGFTFPTSEAQAKDLGQWRLAAISLDGFNYAPDPTIWMSLEYAIKDHLKAASKKKNYDEKISEADRLFTPANTEETLMAARRLYAEASALLPEESHAKERIRLIDEKRKQLREQQQAERAEKQVTDSPHPTTPSSRNVAERNTPVQNSEQSNEALVRETREKLQQQTDAYWRQVEERNRKIEEQSALYAKSFYAAQAVAEGKKNLSALSRLDGNYSSIEELEADFNSKYYSINQQVNTLNDARNEALRTHADATFYDTDATGQAIGETIVAVGTLINNAQAEKEKREAAEALERQRQQKLAEMEAKRKALMLQMRQAFLARFPDGGVPLSLHKVNTQELFFFSYVLDENTLGNDNASVAVTNVFSVEQYSDGTWPFKNGIVNELSRLSKGKVTLMGYYSTKDLAEQMRMSFINLAGKCGMQTTDIAYKGKKSSGLQNSDFWESKDTPDKKDDFWEEGKPQKKTTPKDDFWE